MSNDALRELLEKADKLAKAAEWLADSSRLEWGHDYEGGKDPLTAVRADLDAYRTARALIAQEGEG